MQTRYKDPNESSVVVREKYRFERESRTMVEDRDIKNKGNTDLCKKAMVNNYLSEGKDKLAAQQKPAEKNDLTPFETISNSQYTYTNYNNTQALESRPESECSIFGHGNQSQDDESLNPRPDRASVTSFQSNSLVGPPAEPPKVEKIVRFSGRMSKMSCTSHIGISRSCLTEPPIEEQVCVEYFAFFI